VLEGFIGGMSARLNGGSFKDGFLMASGYSLLSWGAYEMRQAMIRQSCTPPGNPNCTGVSAGAYKDGKKIGGGRLPWRRLFEKDPWHGVGESPLGGQQSGVGMFFGHEYAPGGFLDTLVEGFSGSHDYMSSFRYGYKGTLIPYTSFGVKVYGIYSFAALLPATPFALTVFVPSASAIPVLTNNVH
jgi:hypothetical protein